jgi:hypothetical protein
MIFGHLHRSLKFLKVASKTKLQSISKIAKSRKLFSRAARPRGPPNLAHLSPCARAPAAVAQQRAARERRAAHADSPHARPGKLATKPLNCLENCDQPRHYSHPHGSCKKTPPKSCLHNRSVPDTPSPPEQHRPALPGHASELRLSPTQATGRPAPMAQAPTQGGGTGAAELAGPVATTSGQRRRWRDRSATQIHHEANWRALEHLKHS